MGAIASPYLTPAPDPPRCGKIFHQMIVTVALWFDLDQGPIYQRGVKDPPTQNLEFGVL